MKKSSLLTALFITFSGYAFGQNQDSLTFVKARWEKQKIAPKTRLITHHFDQTNLFEANQQISYIEVSAPGKKMLLGIGADEKKLIITSEFGKKAGAVAALNGTFFDIKNGGSVDFVKVDGKVINTTRLEKNGKRARHQQAAIVTDGGDLTIHKWDGSANWEEKMDAANVMLSGPLLTYNGADQELDTAAFNRLRHPRTAIGIKPNGKVLLLTVDGRHDNSAGMSLFELTRIMRWLGCTSSINLDGGGSTTLWVSGHDTNGVVNYPSDNKKWDHEGERKVANVILLLKK